MVLLLLLLPAFLLESGGLLGSVGGAGGFLGSIAGGDTTLSLSALVGSTYTVTAVGAAVYSGWLCASYHNIFLVFLIKSFSNVMTAIDCATVSHATAVCLLISSA